MMPRQKKENPLAKQVAVRFEESLYDYITKEAKKNERKTSEQVRFYIKEYLRDQGVEIE
jgi:hypothetical protein